LLEVERAELEAKAKQAADSGENAPEIPPEFSPSEVRREIRKEMLFLMPPMALGAISVLLLLRMTAIHNFWIWIANIDWLNAALGSILGGLVGAFVVWITRILGSYTLGKEAMGLGDMHLMLGIGAVLGAGPATITFFLAPFAAIGIGIYQLIAHSRRQLPFGPYLSLAAAFVLLFYVPIAAYVQPGLSVLMSFIRQLLGS